MSNPDRCQNCGAHRASHNPKAHTGCSKFRRRDEQHEASARETEAAFFAVVKAMVPPEGCNCGYSFRRGYHLPDCAARGTRAGV